MIPLTTPRKQIMTVDWTLIASPKEVSSYYHQQGVTLKQTAEHFGVSLSTLNSFLKSNSLSKKTKGYEFPTMMDRVRAISPKRLDQMSLADLALKLSINKKIANTYRWLVRKERKLKEGKQWI
jgi:hypothetical protein